MDIRELYPQKNGEVGVGQRAIIHKRLLLAANSKFKAERRGDVKEGRYQL